MRGPASPSGYSRKTQISGPNFGCNTTHTTSHNHFELVQSYFPPTMSSQVTISTAKPALKRTRTVMTQTKKRSRSSKISGVPRAIAGIGRAFPEKLTVTHKYATFFNANPATNSTSRFTFKCNGMFDPDDRVGGHQPLYFDQLTPVYNHYCVLKSKIKATFVQSYPNGATNPSVICSVTHDDDTSTTANYETQLELAPSRQCKFLTGSQGSTAIVCPWSAKKTFGSNPLDNPRLQGTSSGDPTELSHFNVFVYNLSGVGQAFVDIIVEIEYTVVWFELKTPTGS